MLNINFIFILEKIVSKMDIKNYNEKDLKGMKISMIYQYLSTEPW